MADQRDYLRPRVIPGLVVLCLYLALTLYQNGLLLRVTLAFLGDAPEDYASFGVIVIVFTLVELLAAFAAITLLVLVRRLFVPWVAAASLLFCGLPGAWLQNVFLMPYRQGQPIIAFYSPWDFLELAIVLCGTAWLLKSRNVRDFFDHRLLAQTFE